jgi:hypothetical protein
MHTLSVKNAPRFFGPINIASLRPNAYDMGPDMLAVKLEGRIRLPRPSCR